MCQFCHDSHITVFRCLNYDKYIIDIYGTHVTVASLSYGTTSIRILWMRLVKETSYAFVTHIFHSVVKLLKYSGLK